MPSAAVADINSMLEPISEENPVGSDIREDSSPNSIYYAIKDARNSARAAERNSMFDGNNSEADDHWRKILELAPDIFNNHAKDLEIASWYTEALIRRHGFAGLRDGFSLIHQLVETYWDGLYPLPDEDGIETRVAALTGLNGEGREGVLIAPIRNTAITEDHHPGPFSSWQYKQALEIQKISDEEIREEKSAKLGFNLEDIEATVAKSSDSFYVDLRDDLKIALDKFRETSRLLDEYCGINDSPPTSNIIQILEDTLGIVNHVGKLKFPVETEQDTGPDAVEDGGEDENPASQAISRGPVRNREEAFRSLREISEYFRKAEPHSPISYLLEKAVKWGEMSLNELMKELIPDSGSRDYYSSLTGVRTDDD